MTEHRPVKSVTERSALIEGTSGTGNRTLVQTADDPEQRTRSVTRRVAIKLECGWSKALRVFRFDGEYIADKSTRAHRVWPARFAGCAAIALSVTVVVIVFEVHLDTKTTSTSSASTDSSPSKSEVKKTKEPKDASDSSETDKKSMTSGGSTEQTESIGSDEQSETKDPPATAAGSPKVGVGASVPSATPETGSSGQTGATGGSSGASAATGLDLSIHIETKSEAGSDMK